MNAGHEAGPVLGPDLNAGRDDFPQPCSVPFVRAHQRDDVTRRGAGSGVFDAGAKGVTNLPEGDVVNPPKVPKGS